MGLGTAINAVFGGDTAPLQSAAKRVEGIANGINGVLGTIGVGLSAAFAVGTFVAFGKGAIDLAGKLADLAQQAKINVERLQVLNSIGRDVEGGQNAIAKSLVKVRTSAQEALEGNKAMADNYAVLGIRAREFLALPAEQRLVAIGKAYASATDKNAAYNAVVGIFGEKVGPKMMELLGTLATTSFPKLEASARQAGDVMSAETIAALDRAGDAIEAFKARATISVGNILVNFRSEEGIKLMGLQLLKAATGFGAKIVDALFDAGQLGAVYVHAGLTRATQLFRNGMVEVLKLIADQVNILLPDRFEINVAGLDKFKVAAEDFGNIVARNLGKIEFGMLAKTVDEYWGRMVTDQKQIVDQLNKVELGKDVKKLTDAGKEFKTGVGESADKLAAAGKSAGDSLKEAVAAVVRAIAGIRGAKQFDLLDSKGLAELIRQNERQITEIRRKVREGGTPELAGSLEIGRIQAENMNARQDLAQRTGFQNNLNRLGVDGARRLYDPFVFEELLKRFDESRPLEQKTVDTLDEINRRQEQLLGAARDQTTATATMGSSIERGLQGVAANLKDL
jgi:hypothetical protein